MLQPRTLLSSFNPLQSWGWSFLAGNWEPSTSSQSTKSSARFLSVQGAPSAGTKNFSVLCASAEAKAAPALAQCFSCTTTLRLRNPVSQRVLWFLPMGYICHAIVTVLKNNTAENSCVSVQTTECKWVYVDVMVENIASQLTATSYFYLPMPRNWNVCSGQLGIQKTMPISHNLFCWFLSCIHAIFLKQPDLVSIVSHIGMWYWGYKNSVFKDSWVQKLQIRLKWSQSLHINGLLTLFSV